MSLTYMTNPKQLGKHKKVYSSVHREEFHLKKNNNNLICPNCHAYFDRSQIKIHFYELGQDYAECPGCFKKVKFELAHRRGEVSELTKRYALELIKPKTSPQIKAEEEKENAMETVVVSHEVTTENSVTLGSLLNEHTRLNAVKYPLSYLTEKEIVKLTGKPKDFVQMRRKKAGYTWPVGKPTTEFKTTRKLVLDLIEKGTIAYDMEIFS